MATRKVGGIVAELLLNDKDFTQKLNKASKHTESFAARMRKQFNAAAKTLAATGTAAAGVLAAGIAVANQRLDKLAKTSDKLGIGVTNLQTMRQAAQLSGVSVETLEMAMQRMVRRVAEAAKGTGEAVNALKELGISATDLNRMSPDEQMAKIADAMANVTAQGDRVRLAMKLFDSEGVALVNMLAMGSAGFDEIRAELERYGIALTRLDLKKVEMANDEFTRLRLIQEGLWDQLAIRAAPVLAEIGNRLLDNIDRMGGMGEVAERVINFMLTGAGFVADAFAGWKLILKGLEIGWLTMERTAIGVSQAIVSSIEGAVNKAIDAINWLIRQVNKIPKVNIGELGDFEMTTASSFLGQMAEASKADFQRATGEWNAIRDAGKPSERLKLEFERVSKKWEEHAEKVQDKISEQVEPLTDLSESAKTAAKELDKLSVGDIAKHGGDTPMGRLARRIEDLNRQAMEQEAQGRGEAAGRTRERAKELENQLDLRQKGYSAEEIRSGEAAAAEAAKQADVGPDAEPEAQSGRQVDSTENGSAARWQEDITAMRAAMDKLVSQFAIALT